MKNYFAYGSNLSVDQMGRRCPGAEVASRASLPDHRLLFNVFSRNWGGGVANISPSVGNMVWGLLYRVTDDHINSLDKYEGHPRHYERVSVSVETTEGAVDAWAYVGHRSEKVVPPRRAYLAIIIRAALLHAFPTDYVEMLRRVPVAEDEVRS